eukprot:6755123-Pyramimonas_sp.AAC.1
MTNITTTESGIYHHRKRVSSSRWSTLSPSARARRRRSRSLLHSATLLSLLPGVPVPDHHDSRVTNQRSKHPTTRRTTSPRAEEVFTLPSAGFTLPSDLGEIPSFSRF